MFAFRVGEKEDEAWRRLSSRSSSSFVPCLSFWMHTCLLACLLQPLHVVIIRQICVYSFFCCPKLMQRKALQLKITFKSSKTLMNPLFTTCPAPDGWQTRLATVAGEHSGAFSNFGVSAEQNREWILDLAGRSHTCKLMLIRPHVSWTCKSATMCQQQGIMSWNPLLAQQCTYRD